LSSRDSLVGMESREGREEALQETPFVPPYTQSGKEDSHDRSIEIELDLKESYIRMVQKGANEEEWNQFCHAERLHLDRDKRIWREWTNDQSEDQEEDPFKKPDILPPDPGEPSQTLATPAITPPPPLRATNEKEP
jgi:hypothetical protein